MKQTCNLHVLMIPSWYANPLQPMSGTFFREQAVNLRTRGVNVGLIFPHLRSAATLTSAFAFQQRFRIKTSSDQGVPTLIYLGWAFPKLPQLNRLLWIRYTQKLYKKYLGEFGKPDLIHAQSAIWAGVAAEALSESSDIPFVLVEHSSAYKRGLIEKWQKPLVSSVLRNARSVATVSQALAGQLKPYAGTKKLNYIPNMVDLNLFDLPNIPRNSEPFRFLSIGFLKANKGTELLIRAFAAAFPKERGVELLIGGDGPERQKLEALAKNHSLENRIHFLGLLNREAVRQAMWQANCFVSASSVETFGVVLIEAMATGLPVIAMKSGGPEEFVDETVGFLVQPGSKDDLTKALQRAHRESPSFDPDYQRQRVQRFSPSAVSEKLIAFYHNALEKQKRNAIHDC